jgi:phosphoglycerate dehydrogenase-like enzyme
VVNVAFWPSYAGEEIAASLRGIPGVELVLAAGADELAAAAPAMGALVIGAQFYDAPLAAMLRARAGRLRFIQTFTAGYEGLQMHGVPLGVVVANAGDSWSAGVAEHGMAMLLALVKCLPESVANQTRHAWDRAQSARMGTLEGLTAAIVGYGSIGRAFARLAKPFGMRVVGVSRSARPDGLADEVRPAGELAAVLGRADVVVVAAPHSTETDRMFDAARLAACRRGAILINLARGGLVDQPALVAALRSGQLGGAGLDVTDPEPLPAGDPLWDCPNVLVTPHVGGSSGPLGRARLAAFVSENVARFAAGQTPQHVVAL